MNCLRKSILVLTIIFILFAGTIIMEYEYSEEEVELYRIDIKQVTPDSGITTGHVIAYGHYIKPPYKIEIIDTSLFINGVQISPRILISSRKPEKTKNTKHENEFALDSMWTAYKEMVHRHNRVETYDQIILFTEKLESVDSVKADQDRIAAMIYFKDGFSILVNFHYEDFLQEALQESLTLEERYEMFKLESDLIKDQLELSDRLLIFSAKGKNTLPGSAIFEIAQIITNSKSSSNVKMQNLHQSKNLHHRLFPFEIKEIIYNYKLENWQILLSIEEKESK